MVSVLALFFAHLLPKRQKSLSYLTRTLAIAWGKKDTVKNQHLAILTISHQPAVSV
jgi:hypothetical protein